MSAEHAIERWFTNAQLNPLGAGHIHDTYLVDVEQHQWVLQRVNQTVFVDPQLVMSQTERLLAQWQQQQTYTVPQLHPGLDGQTGQWVDGEYWRLWRYLAETQVVDPIRRPQQARAAGYAFASLQTQLASMPGPRFLDPIKGFMQLEYYLRAYDHVVEGAPPDLHNIIDSNRALAAKFGARNAYVHGDCKVNNLLFDADGERVVAIIDFDTAMWGHWAWDLGDLVRSVSYSSGEVNADIFAACLEGFVVRQALCNIDDSVAAPGYVALMLGVRFLTDHLMGDVYFKVDQAGDNLVRAKQQLDLFIAFQSEQLQMRAAAQALFEAYR